METREIVREVTRMVTWEKYVEKPLKKRLSFIKKSKELFNRLSDDEKQKWYFLVEDFFWA